MKTKTFTSLGLGALGIIIMCAGVFGGREITYDPARDPDPLWAITLAGTPPKDVETVVFWVKAEDGVPYKWLRIQRHDAIDEKRGFDPNYTDITCAFKPMVRKVGDQWEIQFISEIAEKQP